jgi:hypothetical protein
MRQTDCSWRRSEVLAKDNYSMRIETRYYCEICQRWYDIAADASRP